MRDDDQRCIRVRCVLAVARRIHDPGDALGIEARSRLEIVSGLSRQGIELSLADCLETRVAPAHLDRLLSRVASAPRTWVVASANVCTAAVRSIALAVATSPRVAVRPSRRDPVVAELVVRELASDPAFLAVGGDITIEAELATAPGDEVHAYGRDATLAEIASSLPPGVILRGHGTGFGVAAIASDEDVPVAASALARDVVRFDQRGCLSPRVIFCDGPPSRGRDLAVAVERELEDWLARVPLGPAASHERAELALFRRAMEAVGDVHGDEGHLVVSLPSVRTLSLPPAARALVVLAASSTSVLPLLSAMSRFVAAIGCGDREEPLARALIGMAPGARVSALGEMQRPPLDGPVDLRHLEP